MQFPDLSLSVPPTPGLEQQQQIDDHWTNHQKTWFKRVLGEFSTDTHHFYEKVASKVPGKDIEQVKKYFETCYRLDGNVHVPVTDAKNEPILPTVPTNKIANIRNKPPIWTENEHKNFLDGMKKYGIGMWKQIADNCVPSKTAAQILTHAEDFFNKAIESSKNITGLSITINAAAIAIIKNLLEGSSSSKRKVVVDDDHKDNDVIVLDTVPYIPPRKVQRTLNLFPLVSGDYASSSPKEEAEEVQ